MAWFEFPPDAIHIRETQTRHHDAERVIERFRNLDGFVSVSVPLGEHPALREGARKVSPGIYSGKRREAEPLTRPLVG